MRCEINYKDLISTQIENILNAGKEPYVPMW